MLRFGNCLIWWGFSFYAHFYLMTLVKPSFPKNSVGLWDCKPLFRSSVMLINLTLWIVLLDQASIPFDLTYRSLWLTFQNDRYWGRRSSKFRISFINLTRVLIVKLIMFIRLIPGFQRGLEMNFVMVSFSSNSVMLWFDLQLTVNWFAWLWDVRFRVGYSNLFWTVMLLNMNEMFCLSIIKCDANDNFYTVSKWADPVEFYESDDCIGLF